MLHYHGRIDDNIYELDKVQQHNLKDALDAILKGHEVSVQQNEYEISLVVVRKDENSFVGKIIRFDASKDKYTALEIGDKIIFKKENICSIP